MLNIKKSGNSYCARKIIGILSVALLPIITFAQNYGYGMMNFANRGYGNSNGFAYNDSFWFLPFIFIFPVIGVFFAIAIFIFWIMMLVDAIKHSNEKMKLVWVVVIIFAHIIGALIYYFIEKRPRDKTKLHSHKTEEEKI